MASNATAGETGPGGHNIVPSGVVGAEYRLMKEALARETSPLRGMNANLTRDPYHGCTMEPKCALIPSPSARQAAAACARDCAPHSGLP